MIEIKEENCFAHDIGLLIKCNDWKQMEQQILQDHEDAKKWNELENANTHEALVQYAKDRQMIEKIKECLKNVHFTDEGEVLITELEKILEEKK